MPIQKNPMIQKSKISSEPKDLILGLGDLFSALTNLPTLAGKRAGEEAAKLTQEFASDLTALLVADLRAELLAKLGPQAASEVKRHGARRTRSPGRLGVDYLGPV